MKPQSIVFLCILWALSALTLSSCEFLGLKHYQKTQMLIDKEWTLDMEQTREVFAKKAEEATGIGDLNKVKIEGEIGAFLESVTAEKFVFKKNDGGKIDYEHSIGTGLLQKNRKGYCEWNDAGDKLTFYEFKRNSQEVADTKIYDIEELSKFKFVITQPGKTGLRSTRVFTY